MKRHFVGKKESKRLLAKARQSKAKCRIYNSPRCSSEQGKQTKKAAFGVVKGCPQSCGICKCMQQCATVAVGKDCRWRCPSWIAPGTACTVPFGFVQSGQCKRLCQEGTVNGVKQEERSSSLRRKPTQSMEFMGGRYTLKDFPKTVGWLEGSS